MIWSRQQELRSVVVISHYVEPKSGEYMSSEPIILMGALSNT
jgi:hypothetical protein